MDDLRQFQGSFNNSTPFLEELDQAGRMHGHEITRNHQPYPFFPLKSASNNTFHADNRTSEATYDSGYGTSDATSGTGGSTQSYPPQSQLQMGGGATYQPGPDWVSNGAKRRYANHSVPNDVMSFPLSIDTNMGLLVSGDQSRDKLHALECWYTAMDCPEPTPEVIGQVSFLYKLRNDVVEEWFNNKKVLNAKKGSRNDSSNVIIPMTQGKLSAYPPQNIDPILLGGHLPGCAATDISRPFEGAQQLMQSGQPIIRRRTPAEPSHILQIYRSDQSKEGIAQQVDTARENVTNTGAYETIQTPHPQDLDEGSRTMIKQYLDESPNRCRKSRQPKNENHTYSCTSGCGRTFKRCGDWKRHEEINQPQDIFFCLLCPTVKPWIHHRKDKWEKHTKDAHANVKSPLVHKESCAKFKPRCGFCGEEFYTWKQRCDHIGQHFTGKLEKRPMEEWKDPWTGPPKKRSAHAKDANGPPNNDPKNPDYPPRDGGAGAPPSDDQHGGFGSSSGFNSGNGSGAGAGSSRGAACGSSFGQCIWGFGQSGGSSRTDARDLLSCSGKESRHYNRSQASYCEGDHDGQIPGPNSLFYTLDTLGCGSHSVVEKVQHYPTGQTFARKTIRNLDKGISTIQRFREEVNIMKRLDHPHIIQFVAQYADNLSLHVVMSPVADHNLKECLDHPKTLTQNYILLRSIGCLASAVAYLHSVRVRHKDIKPQNILVKDSKVFLTDFGISKTWTDIESTTDSVSAMTPMYAAPEVAAHGRHGTKADVFSLGLVFLEIIAVVNEGSINRLRSHLNNPPDYSATQNLAFGPFCPIEPKPKPKPYYANILPILQWTTSLRFHTSLRPQCAAGLRVLLDLCRLMVQRDPVRRPTASELSRRVPPEFGCGSCSCCIQQNQNPRRLRFQIALPDPFMNSQASRFLPKPVPPNLVSTITRDSTIRMKAAVTICDISLDQLLTGANDGCSSNHRSEIGYIIGREQLILSNSLQLKQNAKFVLDVVNYLEQPSLKGNVDLTSGQLPHSRPHPIGSPDLYSHDLLGFGNWSSLQDRPAIDMGESILANLSNCNARRQTNLEPGLGYGDLYLTDTSDKEFCWSKLGFAVDWITIAAVGSG